MYSIPLRAFLRLIPFAALSLLLAKPCAAQHEPVVSHVAGNLGGLGLADGSGTAARFTYPTSVWSDGQALYIADGGYTIRRMDLATKLVTTIAGTPGVEGIDDGPLASAKFEARAAIWGNGSKLYVAAGSFIRLVDLSTGLVTTIAGSRMLNPSGMPSDGIGGQAQFRRTRGLWGMGRYLYILDDGYTEIRGGSRPGLIRRLDLQTNFVQTLSPVFPAESTTTFQVPTAIWGDGNRDVLIGELDVASTNDVTVAESSVAAQSANMVWSMYVESAGDPGTPGSIQSGVAIAHNEETGANIHFELYGSDGKFLGRSSDIEVPGRWQTSLFLNQIPGLPPIPASFRGILRVWSERNRFSPPAVSVTGLRGRYNERGEFLITSTPAIGEVFATTSSELLFPHFAIGRGYTTEFVLFSDNGSTGTVYFFDQNGNPMSIGLQ